MKGEDGTVQLLKETLSTEEMNKLDEADEKDKDDEEDRKKFYAECIAEKSIGKRLYEMNEPKILIVFAAFGSAILGASNPVIGLLFSRVLGALTAPLVLYGGGEGLLAKMRWESAYFAFNALAIYFAAMIMRKSFTKLSETVTYKMRVLLYDKILQKNIGWFDLKENGTGNLTSTMAQDTSVINMAATEASGPIAEATFALIAGVSIGCYYCWQVALICLGLIPFIIIASGMQRAVTKKVLEDAEDSNKEA